jgi:hypothetical protein
MTLWVNGENGGMVALEAEFLSLRFASVAMARVVQSIAGSINAARA